MVMAVTNIVRREYLGQMVMVVADVNITDYPRGGQYIRPEDFGVAEFLTVQPIPYSADPTGSTLSLFGNDRGRAVEMVDGYNAAGLGKWQHFKTTAAVTDAVNNGAGYAVGSTSIVVDDGSKFVAGDFIAFSPGSVTSITLNVVKSVSSNTLTLKYRIPVALADNDVVALVKRGIGTGVTLSSAVSVNDTTISVSSATGMVIGDVLALSGDAASPQKDAKELVLIRSISGTTITIESITSGLKKAALAHASGAKVYKLPPTPKIKVYGSTMGVEVLESTELGNVRLLVLARA